MATKTYSPRDFTNPKNTERVAKQKGFNVYPGSKHIKIEKPDGSVMVYPNHETGIGLACKIFKFLFGCFILFFIGYSVMYPVIVLNFLKTLVGG